MTSEQREKDLEEFEAVIKAKLANAPSPEAYETLSEFKEVLFLGWALACEYKHREQEYIRGENNELRNLYMKLSDINTEIQNENKKLRNTVGVILK